MICQLCLANVATYHISERQPSGRFEEAHYCPDCYEAKYLKPPPPTSDFPRPRFTLKAAMILVGVFAILNALVAWVMRSGYIPATPDELRLWTLYAFLAVNLVFGFFVVLCGSQAWLDRVMWYKRTGGLVSIPQVKLTRREYTALIVRRTLPYAAWCLVATLLELWLTPKLWPVQRRSLPLFVLILWTPLLLIAARRLSKDHWWRDRIRQDWGAASWAERVLRVAVGTWTIGFILAIVMGGQSLMRWGFVWWFPIPPVMLIGVVVQLVLFALVALLTRRR